MNPLPPLASTKAPTITPALAGAVIQGNTVIIAGAPYALVATSPTGGVIFEVGSGQSVPSGALVYDRAARYYYLGDRGSGKVSGTTNGKTLLFPEQSRPTAGSLALIGGYPAPTRATGTGIDPVLLRPVQPVQRFAQGGIVHGSGGTDSVVIRATPGERISTPQQDQARAAAQPAPIIYQTMVHVHLTMQTLVPDRIAPQQIVRTLGPAIQEEINRMQLRMPR